MKWNLGELISDFLYPLQNLETKSMTQNDCICLTALGDYPKDMPVNFSIKVHRAALQYYGNKRK